MIQAGRHHALASKPQINPKGKTNLRQSKFVFCIFIGSQLDLNEFIELQNYYYKKLQSCQI